MARHRRFRALLTAMALVLAGTVFLAQEEATFKGVTQTVAVYATVTGPDGRLVPDLPRETFSIDDNKKRQVLTLFANDVQPITVVMLLDRSASMRANFGIVEQAAEAFVNAMLPDDKARIGSFSNRIQVDPQDFTSDHQEMLSILHTELQPEGPTPLWNAVNVGITALLHQGGRRVILVFTDGVDSPFGLVSNSLKDVMKRAEEEDVMVYAIGLAGSNGPGSFRRGGGGRGGGGGGGFGGPGGGRGGGRGLGGYGGGGGGRGRGGYGRPGASRGGKDDKPDEGLPKIAAATGGGYFELTSTSDLAATFARVANELHHQYAIGFTPEKLDGKVHALDVHLADPTFTVRARRSYLARAGR